MKKRIIIYFSILAQLILVSVGFTGVLSEIEGTVSVYATNKIVAIEMLTDVYNANPTYLSHIRNLLYGNQHYRIYMDFLRELPSDANVTAELLELGFLMGNTLHILDDISNYMVYHDSILPVANDYSDGVVDEEMSDYLSDFLSNENVFYLMMESYLQQEKFTEFDRLISQPDLAGSISNAVIEKYIIKSWSEDKRDLKGLIDLYGLKGLIEIDGIRLFSMYDLGQYQDVLDEYNLQPDYYGTDGLFELNNMGIDLNYILAYCYFRTGDYDLSEDFFGRVYLPWIYDISRYSFLNKVGSEDYSKAEMYIDTIKNFDARNFYRAFLELVNGNTNEGMVQIEEYIYEMESEHLYLLEAQVLAYTYYRTPELMEAVIEVVRLSMIYQNGAGESDVPMTQMLLYDESEEFPLTSSDIFNNFFVYKECADLIREGDYDSANEKLTDLIISEGISPLIKSLAVYLLREIS